MKRLFYVLAGLVQASLLFGQQPTLIALSPYLLTQTEWKSGPGLGAGKGGGSISFNLDFTFEESYYYGGGGGDIFRGTFSYAGDRLVLAYEKTEWTSSVDTAKTVTWRFREDPNNLLYTRGLYDESGRAVFFDAGSRPHSNQRVTFGSLTVVTLGFASVGLKTKAVLRTGPAADYPFLAFASIHEPPGAAARPVSYFVGPVELVARTETRQTEGNRSDYWYLCLISYEVYSIDKTIVDAGGGKDLVSYEMPDNCYWVFGVDLDLGK